MHLRSLPLALAAWANIDVLLGTFTLWSGWQYARARALRRRQFSGMVVKQLVAPLSY